MADSRRFADWYVKSDADARAARILFENGGDLALVAFHCQQAIEKALKGYILENTQSLLDGHSLVFLIRRSSAFDADIKRFLRECAFVNQFYIEARYPSDLPDEVDGDEARTCLDTAERVLEYIKGQSTAV